MKNLILLCFFIISLLDASVIEGRWHNNSSSISRGELKEIEIRGQLMRPYFKSRHGLKSLSANIALGRGNVKSSAWRVGNGILMILAQYTGNGKLYVEMSQNRYNSYNPIIKRYIFTKGSSHSNRLPFRGEWINPDPYSGIIYKIKIKRDYGVIKIKAWRRCRKGKCLIGKNIARQSGNRLYASMYDGRVSIRAEIEGMEYNRNKNRFEKLRVNITSRTNGAVNRQTIYLFRKHH